MTKKELIEICHYCGGDCPNQPEKSDWLCDGFAGDIDNIYTFLAFQWRKTNG